jgi:dihydrofolate reductase
MNISVLLASSINGMISNRANVPDWLSQEYGQGFLAISQRTNAVIMGKKTYEILIPDHLPLKEEGTLIVLTHDTAATPTQSNVVFTDKTLQEVVRPLLRGVDADFKMTLVGVQKLSPRTVQLHYRMVQSMNA